MNEHILLKNIDKLHTTPMDETDAARLWCSRGSFDSVLWQPKCNQHIQESYSALQNKHIDITRHFIKTLVEEKAVQLEYVTTEKQIADIFTKALDEVRFETLRVALGLCIMWGKPRLYIYIYISGGWHVALLRRGKNTRHLKRLRGKLLNFLY